MSDCVELVEGERTGLSALVAAALPNAKPVAPGEWSMTAKRGEPPLRVRRERDWLVLRRRAGAPGAPGQLAHLRTLLECGAPVRAALSKGRLTLMAEAPIDALDARSLAFLARTVATAPAAERPEPDHADHGERGESCQVVADWLVDSALDARGESQGPWAVRLDGRRAEISVTEDGLVAVQARLAGPIDEVAAVCQEALLTWMGRANAWLRMARLALDPQGAVQVRADWPAAHFSPPIGERLLEAVAAAAALLEAEAAALRHEAVATAYLRANRSAIKA